MKSINTQVKGEELFAGIDLHKLRWHITIRTADVEIFSNSIIGRWEELRKVLNRYKDCRIQAVYEAGYFGFSLYDHLTECGVECIVTPPSLIPQEHGNRVKTDRLDSRKLAHLLTKGLLKSIWVAVSRKLLLCIRRLLLDNRPYTYDPVH